MRAVIRIAYDCFMSVAKRIYWLGQGFVIYILPSSRVGKRGPSVFLVAYIKM